MRNTFSEAKRKAPSILFIDEIDAFPNRSTVTHAWAHWEIQIVNSLLELIDGDAGREGVVVVGACNQPHLLDPALVRAGRLDKHFQIGLPDRAGLERIVREHLARDIPGEQLSGVALSLVGSTGADVERIVRGARVRARKAARAMVLDDLLIEVGGADGRTPEELWRAAVHEAGHAVALYEYAPGTLMAVTLHATGDRGGGTVAVRPGGPFLVEDVARGLVCMLAGRAAEQALLGEASSGSGGGPDSDLASATLAAAISASAAGFSTVQGLVWSGIPTAATLPGMLERSPTLAGEVKRALGEAYETALELVSGRKHRLKALAAALMESRALDQADVHAILDGARAGDVA